MVVASEWTQALHAAVHSCPLLPGVGDLGPERRLALGVGPARDVGVGGAGGSHVEDLLREACEAVIEMLRRLHDDDAVVGGLGADGAEGVGMESLGAPRADRDVDMLRG